MMKYMGLINTQNINEIAEKIKALQLEHDNLTCIMNEIATRQTKTLSKDYKDEVEKYIFAQGKLRYKLNELVEHFKDFEVSDESCALQNLIYNIVMELQKEGKVIYSRHRVFINSDEIQKKFTELNNIEQEIEKLAQMKIHTYDYQFTS